MRHLRVLLLPMLALSHCTPPPPTPEARANAATLAACREHADEAYNRTHRDTIYSMSGSASGRDTPFSANYTPGLLDRGLAQRFGHENMIRDCVRNTGTETDRSASATDTPAPPTPPVPPAPKTR